MRLKAWLGAVMAMLLAVAFVACGGGGDDESGGDGGSSQAADKKLRVGMVLQNFTNPAIKDIADAATDEAKANYPNVEVIAQDSADLEDQVAKAETLISQKVDALGVEPWEGAAIMPTLQKAKDAGIPVFLVQDDAPGAVDQDLAVTYIASDEVEGGTLVGKWLAEELGGSGKVAILEGAPGDSPAVDRTKGFLEGIKGSQLDVAAKQTANWARDEGLTVATDLLTAQPDLKAIFAHNDEMAFGAREALGAAGKDDVIVIGYNGTCTGLEATGKGEFQAEGILFLDLVGREFIRNAVKHLNDEQVEPRIQPPVAVLATDQVKAIASGDESTELEGLKERIDTATAGSC